MDMTLVAAIAVLAFIVAPAVYATTVAWRVTHGDGRLRLFEVLRGQALPLPESASEAAVFDGAQAVRRCVCCPSQEACDRLLARADWKALSLICPNQDYIDRQR